MRIQSVRTKQAKALLQGKAEANYRSHSKGNISLISQRIPHFARNRLRCVVRRTFALHRSNKPRSNVGMQSQEAPPTGRGFLTAEEKISISIHPPSYPSTGRGIRRAMAVMTLCINLENPCKDNT